MPSVLSKLKDNIYGREWSFPYNCYEVGHGWTPFCTEAAVDVGLAAFKNVLPLYTSLYLFTQLGLQRKYSPQAFLETSKSILTSASFLGFNLFAGIGASCLLRNNSDRYYYRIQCFLPGLIASYMALHIERPGRRPALAFYMANMASELLFKWLVQAGLLRPLPHGETLLFMVGMACWLRFVRIHGFSHDPVSVALKYLVGPLEAKSRARAAAAKQLAPASSAAEAPPQALQMAQERAPLELEDKPKRTKSQGSALRKLDEQLNLMMNQVFGAHECCPHAQMSCAYYAISPTVTRFTWGYLGRSLLNIAARFRLLRKEPGRALNESFRSKESIHFGMFLATFVGVSRVAHCLLRRYCGRQEVWHSSLAGALSGTSMLWAPKSTLSIYVIWKCIEQYFFLLAQSGQIKRANEFICALYAVSVNTLLYIFAIEPHFIRPSYMKFIDKISDHRLHQVNRMGEYKFLYTVIVLMRKVDS